jgi:hypothetical protein
VAPAVRSSDFLNSLGVNTHLIYTSTTYADTKLVIGALKFLGITHVRDQLPPSDPGFWRPFREAMDAGIKFDLVVPQSQTGIKANLLTAESLIRSYPGGVAAIEGLNEIDGAPKFAYAGLLGMPAAIAYQRDLYAAIKADKKLANVVVYNMSLRQGGNHAELPSQSGSSSYGNSHIYFMWVPPAWNLGSQIAADSTNNPGEPMVITETGYVTMNRNDGSNSGFVDSDVQAKFLLDDYLDAFKLGVVATYVYELLDENADPLEKDHENHWGLFNADGTPKKSATALHNLTAILNDTGRDVRSFSPGSLAYSLRNTARHSSILLAKSNGAFCLVIWNEPELWNHATATPNEVASSAVTIIFGGKQRNARIYDPLVGVSPILTLSNVNQITTQLIDHAIIVEIVPSTNEGAE